MKKRLLYLITICFCALLSHLSFAQTNGIGSGNALRLSGAGQYGISNHNGGFSPAFHPTLGFNYSFWVKFEQDPATNNAWLVDIANNLQSVASTTIPTNYFSMKYIAWNKDNGWHIGFRDNTRPSTAAAGDDGYRSGDFVDFYFTPTAETTPQQNVWIHVSGSIVVTAGNTVSAARMVINGIELNNVSAFVTAIGLGPAYTATAPAPLGATASNSTTPLTVNRTPRPVRDASGNYLNEADAELRAFVGLRPQGNFANTGSNFQIDELLMYCIDKTAAQARTNMCVKFANSLGLTMQTYYKFDEVAGSTTAGDFNNNVNGGFDTKANIQMTLVGGATTVLSGAPIGNSSNAGAGTTLAYSTGTVGVNVGTGTPSVLHIYNVASTPAAPNNVNPTGMSSIDNQYFGVFTGRSATNLTYTLTYNHGGTATLPNPPNPATSPLALAVAQRLRNDGGAFVFASTATAAATTHTLTGQTMDLAAATPRNQQEFIYGSLSNPILANIEAPALAYTEGNAATAITGTTTVTYGGAFLTSGTVQITSNYQNGQDILGFVNGNYGGVAFSGTFTAGTGLMTITPDVAGTATPAAMQAALRAVTYFNNSGNPNTSVRTVTFTVFDGALNSNTQTRNINITAVNTRPTLNTQVCSGGTFTEGGAATQVLTSIVADDVDNTSLSTATITITNLQTSDVLSFTAIGGNPVTAGTFSAGTLTLNANGATHAQMSAALASVFFSNTSQNPNTTARNISFTVSDGSLSSTPAITCNINVTPVNNPPVITGISGTLTYTKLSPAINVLSGVSLTDPDDTQLTAATVFITGGTAFSITDDEFRFTVPLPAGITAGVGQLNGTGVAQVATINFTGTASLATYRALLASLTYRRIAGVSTTRNVAVQVTDNGSEPSALPVLPNLAPNPSVNITVDMNFNVAPTFDAGCATMGRTFTEGDAGTTLLGVVDVNDADGTELSKVEFKITIGYINGQDELFYDGPIPPATLNTSWDAPTGTYTIIGADLITVYETFSQNVKYRNNGGLNPTGGNRTITVQFFDRGFPVPTVANEKGTNICSFTLSVVPVNNRPVLDNIGANNYTEKQPAIVIIDNILNVSDPDNTTLLSATAQITANYLSTEDELSFSPAVTGITTTWNSTTGTLTLTGVATLATYQTALQSIRYRNTSNNPNLNTRTVTFILNDGQALNNLSVAVTRNITITPVNDNPVLANIETSIIQYTEGNPATQITNTTTVSDVDNTTLLQVVVTISGGFANGEDVLEFTSPMGNPVGPPAATSTTGTMTLTHPLGTGTLAQFQEALRNIRYRNTSQNPTAGLRTISFQANDGQAANNLSTTVTRQINVIPVNNPPALLNNNTAQTYTEKNAPVVIFPTPANFTINDVDNTTLASATISITNNYFSNQDVLAFTNQLGITGIWNDNTGVLTLTGTSTLANYQTAIRTITYRNTSFDPSALQRTISITVNDGAANSNTVTQLMNVVPVNDIPTIANFTRRINVNGTLILQSDGFSDTYADVERTPMQSIRIVSLPTRGSLTLNNAPVTAGQVILTNNIFLTYRPDRDFEGNDSFQWQAFDGTDFSATSNVNIQIRLTDIYPPDKLKVQAGSRQVLLSWDPVFVEGVRVEYEVYIFSVNQPLRLVGRTNEEKFLITGLENTVTYTFRVVAIDNLDRRSGLSDPISARPSIVLGTEDELTDLQLMVFPNPNTGNFIVQFVEKASKKAQIHIVNTLGQQVFGKEIQSNAGRFEEKIEINTLGEGTYILQISTDKNTYQKRFVVQK